MKNKHSAVVLVFNDKNELALQLRAAGDDSYPLHWDVSAAGGMNEGEDSLKAAHREMKEEIGIEGELVHIGDELYEDEFGTDMNYVYATRHNGPFEIDPKEVERIEFFNMQQIEEMLKSNEKFHPEFVFLWQIGLISKALKLQF